MAQAPSPSIAPYIESAMDFGDGSNGIHSSSVDATAVAQVRKFSTFDQSAGTYSIGDAARSPHVLQCQTSFNLGGVIDGIGDGGNDLLDASDRRPDHPSNDIGYTRTGWDGKSVPLMGIAEILNGNYTSLPSGGGHGGRGIGVSTNGGDDRHYAYSGRPKGGATLVIASPSVTIGASGRIRLNGQNAGRTEVDPSGHSNFHVTSGAAGDGALYIIADNVTIESGAEVEAAIAVILYTQSLTKLGATLPDSVFEKQLRLVGPATDVPSPVVVAFQNKVRDWLIAEMTSPAYGVFGDASYSRGEIVHTRNMMLARAVLMDDGAHLATAATRTLIEAELEKRSGAFYDRMNTDPWKALLEGKVSMNKRFYSSQDSATATHADGSALWDPSTVAATTVIPEFNSVKFHDVYRWLGFTA